MARSPEAPVRHRLALVVLCTAEVLVMLDGVVVTVALPTIQTSLDVAQRDLQWIVTAYTLPLGAFLLIGGRAGDLYGRRRVLMAGLVVFSAASLGAGLAGSFVHIVVARALQGLGAALAVPATLALLTAAYRRERERRRAIGILSTTLDVAMVTGLVLGGILTASVGWPWCFFVVVPLGLLAAAAAPMVLEESRDPSTPPLDVVGAALAAAGFGLLAFGLARGEHGATRALWPAAVGVVLLAGFVLVERRLDEPLVRLSAFRQRSLTGSNLAIVTNSGCFIGLMFLATLYMQQRLQFTPLVVGLSFVPLALSSAAGGLCAPLLVDHYGARRCAAVFLALTAATFGWLAYAVTTGGYLAFVPGLVVSGFGFAAAFVPLTAQAMAGARPDERGLASGLFQTATHLGGALVLAMLSTVAATLSSTSEGRKPAATEGYLDVGFTGAFLAGAAVLTLGALVAAHTMPRQSAAR